MYQIYLGFFFIQLSKKDNKVLFRIFKSSFTENIELNQNAALNKNIDVLFESTEKVEIETDKNMIDTIVQNLLNSAIKFTNKKGKIAVAQNSSRIYNFQYSGQYHYI